MELERAKTNEDEWEKWIGANRTKWHNILFLSRNKMLFVFVFDVLI